MAELVRLSILDTYGVRWSREALARDLVQNFFDAHGDFEALSLRVDVATRTVEIRGPQVFDLTLLFYVGGTTKRDDSTVGGFGEGFKIAALVAVRDLGVRLWAGSGPRGFEVVLDPVPLGRELCYAWAPEDPTTTDAWLRLTGCDDALLAAFAGTPLLFRHRGHPELQQRLACSADGRAAVYRGSVSGVGLLFYRRQKRGVVGYHSYPAIEALHLCYDGAIDALEGDRDRRDLAPNLLAEAIGGALEPPDIFGLLLHLQPFWEQGHPVLSALLKAAASRGLRFEGWPSGWLAGGGDEHAAALAKRQGFRIALVALGEVGMPRVAQHYQHTLVTRAPTPKEAARSALVEDLYRRFMGAPEDESPQSKPRKKRLEVFDDPEGRAAILGQHFSDRIVMNAAQLAGELPGAGATLLHEYAHEVGGDQDEAFWRRLEVLLFHTLAAPADVRAVRERFAAEDGRNAPVEPPPPPDPFADVPPAWKSTVEVVKLSAHAGTSREDMHFSYVQVFVPPGLPGTGPFVQQIIKKVETRPGHHAMITVIPVWTEERARRWSLPGLPTVRIDGFDVQPVEASPDPLRVRSYGGHALPDLHLLTRLDAPDEAELAYDRISDLAAPGREADARPPDLGRELRRMAMDHWSPWLGDELESAWACGCAQASTRLIAQVVAAGPPGRDEAFAEVKAGMTSLIQTARRLRAEDPDFDDADALERQAMGACQGLAVAAGADGGEAAARAIFATARALCAEAFQLDTGEEARATLIALALDAAWWTHKGERPVPAPEVIRADYELIAAALKRFEAAAWIRGEGRPHRRLKAFVGEHRGNGHAQMSERHRVEQAADKRQTIEAWRPMFEAHDAELLATRDPVAAAARCLAVAQEVLK
jgi:hypothetical protein